jgi:hypothetical protein
MVPQCRTPEPGRHYRDWDEPDQCNHEPARYQESTRWRREDDGAFEALGWWPSEVDDMCEAIKDRFRQPQPAFLVSRAPGR